MENPLRSSRADQAHQYIASEILSGRWRTGDILSTYALAEELDISRTPISEALKRLEADGLVVIIPQVGCRVSMRPDQPLIEELSLICGALAGLAAESAAKLLSAGQFARLERLVIKQEHADFPSFLKLIELCTEFYQEIAYASKMQRLSLVSRGTWSLWRHQLLGYLPDEALIHEMYRESAQQQRAILEALKSPTGDGIRALCEQHIATFGTRLDDNRAADGRTSGTRANSMTATAAATDSEIA